MLTVLLTGHHPHTCSGEQKGRFWKQRKEGRVYPAAVLNALLAPEQRTVASFSCSPLRGGQGQSSWQERMNWGAKDKDRRAGEGLSCCPRSSKDRPGGQGDDYKECAALWSMASQELRSQERGGQARVCIQWPQQSTSQRLLLRSS